MMTKNTLLALIVALFTLTAKAQISNYSPEYPIVAGTDFIHDLDDDATAVRLGKKAGLQGSGWYNYRLSLGQGGETFVYFGGVSLWPDSLPVIVTNTAPFKTHAFIFALGQVFDPTSEWFQDQSAPQLTGFNRYSIDTIAFRYKYRHVVPGSVDTLLVDFFNDDKLAQLVFTGGARAYAPVYLPSKNRGASISSTKVILLDDSYNTTSFFYPRSTSYSKLMEVALPAPMNVKGGGKMAFTITFKPGVSWKINDTLVTSSDSVNLPVKQTNSFEPYYLQAETGVPDNSHNYALTSFDNTRYSTRSTEWYYPNNGFAKIRHMDAYYKLTYYNLSSKDLNKQGYGLGNLYPNPVKAGNDVRIEFALGKGENVNIQLYNILGSKVADVASGKFSAGENNVIFSTSDLTPGVYVYTMTAGSFKASKKITIVD